MHEWINRMDDVSRRRFMHRAAGTFLGVSVLPTMIMPGYAQAAARKATADRVIYLYLTGGMSHLDSFDPKPGSDVMGPTEVIDTNVPGIQVGSTLSRMAKQMDKVALVRSLSSKQGAHERGQYFMRTSYTPIATTRHPALGAWVSYFRPNERTSLPSNVMIGNAGQHPGAGFMESRFAPLPIGSPTEGLKHAERPRNVDADAFDRRLKMADKFDAAFQRRYPQKSVRAYTDFYADAVKLMTSKDLDAFDITKESPATRAAYGGDENRLGQGMLLARRLVENGARFVEVNDGGWDTHNENFTRLDEKLPLLDEALAALLGDLQTRGMLGSTLVVLATEFGRTPKINQNTGRDHHPAAFTCLLAGGGVRGGYVHGASDERGFRVAADGVGIPDFNATIAHALGLDVDERVFSPDRRPFQVAHEGKPITALLT